MMINTCKGCEKRHRACWDSCPEYLEARKELEANKAARLKEKLDNRAIGALQYHGLKKRR